MPVFEVYDGERYPDFRLTPAPGKTAGTEKQVFNSGGWMLRTRIELTADDYENWCRVRDEYEAWIDRIGNMESAARFAARAHDAV